MRRARHVAIIGAGPTGLDAALACRERGLGVTIYERGSRVGANVRDWGHVELFTPWRMNASLRMRRHLNAAGVDVPDGEARPTGDELATRLLDPVAALPGIAPAVRLGESVRALGRDGLTKDEEIATPERAQRPLRLLVSDCDGAERIDLADIVLDCTGTWGNPNSLGDGGIPAPGERAFEARLRRGVPNLTKEALDWAGRTILLLGGGHSAQTAARDLAELARRAPGTRVLWAVRRRDPDWAAVANDPLPARAALVAEASRLHAGASPAVDLRAGTTVQALAERDGRLAVTLRNGDAEEVLVDAVISLTGTVGDNEIYRQLQVHECYATCAPMQLSAALLGSAAGDCLAVEVSRPELLRNPEPGFFILGSKSHGRFGLYLLRIGYGQVDQVMGMLV